MKPFSTYAEFIETELIADKKSVPFSLQLSDQLNKADASLVLDLYDLNNPSHPEGHLGWWKFPLNTEAQTIQGSLQLDPASITLTDGTAPIDSWVNPEKVNAKQCILIAVLRANTSNAILHMHKIPVFLSKADHTHYRETRRQEFTNPARFAESWFLPASKGSVRIVCSNIFAKDAVGQFCFDIYQLCQQNHIPVELYAEYFDLGLNTLIHRESKVLRDTTPDDTIIYFHSTYDPLLPEIAELKAKKKITYFHGITQPKLLRVFDIELSMVCEKAYEQLPLLAAFDVLAANSNATAAVLKKHAPNLEQRTVDVVPPKLMPNDFIVAPAQKKKAPTQLLYVGRIKSHKKVEDIVALYADYLKLDPQAECIIVGGTGDKPYMDYLSWLQEQHFPKQQKIKWLGQVSHEKLKEVYSTASAYICMSEDEGFCIPLIEAMIANIPVFAYGIPAVKEILNEAGVYFTHKDFPVLAQDMHKTLSDENRVNAIIQKQQDRIQNLLPKMDGRGILRWLAN
jgi:glycosyltransferase involved in cell wall biosynthesis